MSIFRVGDRYTWRPGAIKEHKIIIKEVYPNGTYSVEVEGAIGKRYTVTENDLLDIHEATSAQIPAQAENQRHILVTRLATRIARAADIQLRIDDLMAAGRKEEAADLGILLSAALMDVWTPLKALVESVPDVYGLLRGDES